MYRAAHFSSSGLWIDTSATLEKRFHKPRSESFQHSSSCKRKEHKIFHLPSCQRSEQPKLTEGTL